MSVAPPPEVPVAVPPPPSLPPLPPEGPGPWRRGIVWRMLLGCLIVLLASAGASAVFVLEQAHTVVHDLDATKALKVDSTALAQTSFGQPETLLLVGDDVRTPTNGFKYYNATVPNLANEMLLIRIDPSKPFISMMSLPRELWVPITEPDGVTYTNRLNSAYTYGATTLLNTIRHVTGLVPNHVIATTFTQFENAINTLGCVYDTIDERYYHNNADGGDQYQNIDLQPGYQCLNGSEAEQFVSYRHTDTSQIRDSRDQSFLLAVKQQYGPQLAGNLGKFEKIFGETVQTDSGLRSYSEIFNLANLLVTASGLTVRQVPFPAVSCCGVPPGDLYASPQQIQASVRNFLYGAPAAPTRQIAATGRAVRRPSVLAHLPLTRTLASNLAVEKASAATLQLAAEFPKVQDEAGSATPVAPLCTEYVQACIRNYLIHSPNGDAYPIYVEVFSNGQLGQYYDVQGTTWTHAPLLAHPNQTLRISPRTYDLYWDGADLEMVAWRENGAAYWVHNTLTNTVSNGELLAIAEQTAPITAVPSRPKPLVLKAVAVPKRKPPTIRTPVLENVGWVGGLATLVAFPLLMIAIIRRQLVVRRMRNQLQQILAIESRLAAVVPALALVPAGSVPSNGAGAFVDRRDFRARRWRPATVVPVIVALLAAVAAGGYLLTEQLSQTPSPPGTHSGGVIPAGPPSGAVAVLDAGRQRGAASRLAAELRAKRVDVPANLVGNLHDSLAPGLWILYSKGAKLQAEQLAAILKANAPNVAPIDVAAQTAAGPRTHLVVVIA